MNSLFFFIGIFFLGLIIGSFLNMIIYRLPLIIFQEWRKDCHEFLNTPKLQTNDSDANNKEITFFKPSRSFCPHCSKQIAIKDNIPVLSFFLLRGKCRDCQNKIHWQYPLIELITAASSVLVLSQFDLTLFSLSLLFLSYLLITIAFIDYNHMIIPDSLTYIGLWLGLIINTSMYQLIPIEYAISGAILGYMILWLIYWVFKLITHKEGFGHGDFKLSAMFGAWLGVYNLFPMLILASILGISVAVVAHISKRGNIHKPFPFGPYLALSGWLMLLFQNTIIFY